MPALFVALEYFTRGNENLLTQLFIAWDEGRFPETLRRFRAGTERERFSCQRR